MFKVGDMVRCVDGMEDSLYNLTTGEIYEVVNYYAGLLMLKGVNGRWRSHRFEIVYGCGVSDPPPLEPPVKEKFIVVIDEDAVGITNTLQEALDLGSEYRCDIDVEIYKLVKTRVIEKTWR